MKTYQLKCPLCALGIPKRILLPVKIYNPDGTHRYTWLDVSEKFYDKIKKS